MARKTKTISKKFLTGSALVMISAVLVLQSAGNVFADRYDDAINQIQNEVGQYEAEANRLRSQADTLQNALSVIVAEKNAIQAQINLNEAKLAQLRTEIAVNEEKLERQKRVLSKTIAQIYVNGDTSPIEVIASSKSLGDYVSAQEVRNSVRNQMKLAMDSVKELRDQLEIQSKEVEDLLAEQNGQRQRLAVQENEQNRLLEQTRGEESAYQNLIANRNSEIQRIRNEQAAAYAAARAAWGGGYVSVGGSGGYPWAGQGLYKGCSGSCTDPWELYVGQCVSYVAWRLDAEGYRVYEFDGRGNAAEWPSTTTDYWASLYGPGSAAQIRYAPQAGYAAVDPNLAAPYGHVMYIEEVLGGGYIRISEYNFQSPDSFSQRDIPSSGLIFLEFARK